jgi:hypothetical protein
VTAMPLPFYLTETPFNAEDAASYYTVAVDAEGPVVHSGCCSDRIVLATARELYAALGRWIADQPDGAQ